MKWLLERVDSFPKNQRFVFGQRLADRAIGVLELLVEAAYSKRRRRDVLPMRRDLAEYIARWMQSRRDLCADEPLLRISGKRTAEMLRTDLERARTAWLDDAKTAAEKARRAKSSFLQYRDEAGRVADFHALRKTFITNLCRAGVSPKAAQSLARHSDINLTMNVYTMLSAHDHASAVEALPAIPQPKQSSPGNGAGEHAPGFSNGAYNGPAKRRGRHRKVPTVVPRGAEYGAKRLAQELPPAASRCTKEPMQSRKRPR